MSASKQIDALGGTGAVAALCGLHKSSVSQWRRRGIPKAWKRFLATVPKPVKRTNGT
jgi:DNA-binding transcriptional regulator YdaS (Cro superfamily)